MPPIYLHNYLSSWCIRPSNTKLLNSKGEEIGVQCLLHVHCFLKGGAVVWDSSIKPVLPHSPETEGRDYMLCIPTTGNALRIHNSAWALCQAISTSVYQQRNSSKENTWHDNMKADVHWWVLTFSNYFFSPGIKNGVSMQQVSRLVWWLCGETEGLSITPYSFGDLWQNNK
jgi:hypothetical protein